MFGFTYRGAHLGDQRNIISGEMGDLTHARDLGAMHEQIRQTVKMTYSARYLCATGQVVQCTVLTERDVLDKKWSSSDLPYQHVKRCSTALIIR